MPRKAYEEAGVGPRDVSLAEVYDLSAGKFTPVGSLSEARYKHAAVPLADGKVLVAGGSDARDWRGLLSSAELCDPSSRSLGGLPPRGSAPSSYVALTTAEAHVNSVPQHWTQHNHDDYIIGVM